MSIFLDEHLEKSVINAKYYEKYSDAKYAVVLKDQYIIPLRNPNAKKEELEKTLTEFIAEILENIAELE